MFDKKYLFSFIGLLSLIFINLASAQTNITSCPYAISSSGDYQLNQAISSATTCLTIASSNVNFDCQGNTLSYNTAGGATNYGINAIYLYEPLENITIKNCIIRDTNAAGTPSAGIQLTRVSNSYFFNNTIQTNGTAANYGIYLTTASKDNIIENNTINAFGSTTGNIGIYLTTGTEENIIRGNTAIGTGTTTSYALYLSTDADNNLVVNNSFSTISTAGTGNTDSHTAYILSSNNNNISGNYIYSQGFARNYAVYSATNANDNIIENNNIIVNGTTANYGIYVLRSPFNKVTGNTITAIGTGTLYGIINANAQYTLIKDNIITINTPTITGAYGISVSASPNNTIQNNTISIAAASTVNGISSTTSSDSYIDDNSISITGSGAATTFNGVLTTTSNLNDITNNNIQITGITILNGVLLTTSGSNSIENNSINVTGTGATNNGIYLSAAPTTIVRNNSIYASGTTPIYGIYALYSSMSNLIENNTVTTAGTTANPAVILSTGANENIIRNNILMTRGSTTLNYGIQIISSNNNLIESNNISTNGTTSNYGIYLLTHAERNILKNNTISTFGTTTNYGIFLSSASNNDIISNNIIANGTTQTGTTNNWGIHLAANSENNEIYNNTIITGGGGLNYGLSLITTSRYNTYKGNNIQTGSGGVSNHGIYLAEANNNLFENNVISTSGTGTDYGVYFYSSSDNNLVKDNNISTFGAATSHAFDFLFLAAGGYPENNNISGNNLLSITGRNINFETASINGTWLIDQEIGNYSFTGIAGAINIKNTSAGEISFNPILSGTNTTFSDRIFINNNFARIDEYTTLLNKSAEITLYNLPTTSTELYIARNGVLCNGICTNLTSLQAGNVTFNVTGGGNYSILASSGLPAITLNLPEDSFNTSAQTINFNFTATDDSAGDLNCGIYLDSILNQTNSTTQNNTLTNFLVENIAEGNHSWYVECFDSAGNRNVSETRNLNISISSPTISLDYPENNIYLNDLNSIQLNYTVFDNNVREMTVWLYGDEQLLNTSENIANGTPLNYTWGDLSLGQHNWTVVANNGIYNSSSSYSNFTLINLTINCETGGPYRSGGLVLIYGNISDGISGLSYQSINASLYKEGSLNVSRSLTSLNDGSFQTSFSSLADGNYTLNTTFSYQGYNKSCADNFTIGGELAATSASFVLDKIISLQQLNPTNVTYNITLRTTNKGGSTANSINLTDSDSIEGSYNLGTLTAGNSASAYYTKTYQRNSTNYNVALAIASVNGTDALLNNEISANSSEITLVVPATTANTSLTLTKNVQYLEENTTSVTYNLSIEVINSGGIDLTGIDVNDSDINLSTTINLNRTLSYSTSGTKRIDKISENREYIFLKANATYDSITYQSNQLSVLIPTLENNASLSLNKIASVYNSTNTNIIYNISLVLTNSGGRNAALTNITDSDSPEPLYEIGTLTAGQTLTISYLKTYNKSSLDSNQELVIAIANAIDSLSNNLINSASSSLIIFIPALETNVSLLLSKSASLHLTNNTHIVYNITLSLTNKGGRNATNAYVYDSNFSLLPYPLGNLTAGQTAIESYLLTFSRIAQTTSQTLNIATANATDLISNNLIEANSSEITITIPARSSSASFVLDKIASFYNITNETFTYNTTLRLTNKGGSSATNVNITDLDYIYSNFSIGDLAVGETITRSYLLNFTRNSTNYYNSTSIAQAFGIDSFSNSLISANSSSVSLTIPSQETGPQLTLVKNVIYNNQTSANVNYTITLQVVNSGGVDLASIHVTDTDLSTLPATISLNKSQSASFSGEKIITKVSENHEHEFNNASAEVNDIFYGSNIIKIIIPGFGNGPNDLFVSAPSSVLTSTSFDSTIRIVNKNPDIGQDFTIDYWIPNLDSTANLSSGSATLFVSADSGENITTITFNSPSTAGTYIFMAKVRESGKEASDSIVVTSSTPETPSSGGSSGGGGSITGKTIIRPENLMDVLIKILEEYETVTPGGKVMAEITFLNLGTEEIKDAVFTYCIQNNNNNNNIGDCIKETVAVQTKVQLVRKIVLPTKIEEGGYYFDVNVDYMNKTVESRDTFEVIAEGKSTPIPRQEVFNIKLDKSYLIIGAISLASVVLFVLISIVIIKRRKRSQKVAVVESKLQNLKELKAKGEISEKVYHRERERLLQRVSGIFKGKTMSLILSGIGLFALVRIFTMNQSVTGYVIEDFASNNPFAMFGYFILLIGAFGLFIFMHRQKIRKKYPKNSVKSLINKKVYSESGHYLGKVNDIILGENRIDSLKIEIDKKFKFKAKGITVDYKQVKSVSEIVIINEAVAEHLKKSGPGST